MNLTTFVMIEIFEVLIQRPSVFLTTFLSLNLLNLNKLIIAIARIQFNLIVKLISSFFIVNIHNLFINNYKVGNCLIS